MPSQLTRLQSIFPGYRPNPFAQPTVEQRASLVKATQKQIEAATKLPPPRSGERVPANYGSGVAGKVWFLPYQDTTTKDSPEIRAAMRLMRRDGYVKAAWEPQILTVASEDWQIQPSEPGNADSEEQADFVRRVIEDYLEGGMISLVRAICAPLGSDGFSLGEKVWEIANRGQLEKKVVLRAVKAKDPDYLRIEGDRFNNVQSVQSLRNQHQDSYPISDFIYSRYLTVFDEPLGEAVFRPAYSPYWMRDTVRKLRVIHHEKKMAGMLAGTYQSDDDKGPLEDALRNAKSSTWISIPEGTRIEALALSQASEPDYKSFDESLRDEIVTAIAFATLQIIQGNVPDARGDSKVQKAMADLGPWILMTIVTDAVNNQLSPQLIDFNYPYPAGGGYPKLTFGSVSNAELLEQLQLLEGYQRAGFNPSKSHYAKTLSVQQADPNDPEDVIQPPGMGGMGGMMGGMPGMGGMGGDMGGGGLPPDGGDPFGGGGGEMFSEQVWEAFREPVKWQRDADGYWRSENGRRLSDPAYQRHKARLKQRGGGSRAQAPRAPEQRTQRRAAGGQSAPVATTPTGTVPGSQPPAQPEPPIKPAAAKARRRVKELASTLVRAEGKVANAVAWGIKKLGSVGAELGYQLKRLPLLEEWTGLGNTVQSRGRRLRVRFQAVQDALKDSPARGNKLLGRELTRLLGVRWSESRRKYGVAGAIAIEGAMLGWMASKAALLGAVGTGAMSLAASAGLGAGTGSALAAGGIWAATKAYSSIQGILGLQLTPYVRKTVETGVRSGLRAVTGGYQSQRPSSPVGRVAQAIQVAERWKPDTLAMANIGAGAGLLGQKKNITRVSGKTGRVVATISRQDAARWLLAKREIEAADREGRPVRGVRPEDEPVVRAAMKILADEKQVIDERDRKVAKLEAQEKKLREAAKLARERKRALMIGERFAEEPEDTSGVVADLRFALDEAFAVMGVPDSSDIPDDALAGSLAASIAIMDEMRDQAEAFSEWESFGFQAAQTRRKTIKAVGTGEHAGQVLYGQAAKEALARDRGASKRQKTPRNVSYTRTDAEGNTTKVREKNVPPERAWAMALASKIAAIDEGGDRVTDLKVTKARQARKKVEQDLTAAAQNPTNSEAVNAARGHAETAIREAAANLATAPKPSMEAVAAVTTAWEKSAERASLPRRHARAIGGLLSEAVSEVGNDVDKITNAVGSVVKYIGKLAAPVAKAAAWALGRVAVGIYKAGRFAITEMAPDILKGGKELAGSVLGPVWTQVKKFLGPVAWYVGGITAAAAILAVPTVLAITGVIPLAAGFAAAPFQAGAAYLALRRSASNAARVVGQNYYGYQPEKYGLQRTSAIFDGHAERVGRNCEHFAEEASQVALAGKDGQRAISLLANAKDKGSMLLATITEEAVKRMMASGNPLETPVLFNDDQLKQIQESMSAAIAVADLLGRARVRERARIATVKDMKAETFAEPGDPFVAFAEPIPMLHPVAAVDYFQRLVPTIGKNVQRYGPLLDRHAFTLAVATDQTILERVKDVIAQSLQTGVVATPDIQAILDEVGVSQKNPQYAEMVYRTNVMDAYNQGSSAELQDPEMQEFFPAWRYEGIDDNRAGDDHRPKFGRYYPSVASFAEVRGNRVWNCRCSATPVSKYEMDELGRQGIRVESSW